MLKEEKYIEKQFGKANSFKVPNGYFEGFSSKIMDKLTSEAQTDVKPLSPISARKSFWIRYRLAIGSVAAGICITVLSLGAYIHKADTGHPKQSVQQIQMATSLQHSDNNIDEFVNYTMMDTEDMYAYMADAN